VKHWLAELLDLSTDGYLGRGMRRAAGWLIVLAMLALYLGWGGPMHYLVGLAVASAQESAAPIVSILQHQTCLALVRAHHGVHHGSTMFGSGSARFVCRW